MTYFSYQRSRGTRGETVYAGSTRLGRVIVQKDWRSRLTLSPNGVDLLYRAVGLEGEALPGLFLSRHDAAEALNEVASPASEANAASPGIVEA
jgi:hypothetical protein